MHSVSAEEWQSQIFLVSLYYTHALFLTVYLFKHEVVIIKGICINLFQFLFFPSAFVEFGSSDSSDDQM